MCLRICAVSVLLTLAGCPRHDTQIDMLVQQYIGAIKANQPMAAYALLSTDVKNRVSKTTFLTRWKAFRGELGQQATALEKQTELPEKSAIVTLKDGTRIELAGQKQWLLSSSTGLATRPRSPRAAIQALITALKQRDYGAISQLLSKPIRDGIEREITLRIGELEAALTKTRRLLMEGDRAAIDAGKTFRVELRRARNGTWMVEDFDL